MHACIVGVVHLVDIKFGDFKTMMINKHLIQRISQGLPEILSQIPLVLVLPLVWRLKKNLPNRQI